VPIDRIDSKGGGKKKEGKTSTITKKLRYLQNNFSHRAPTKESEMKKKGESEKRKHGQKNDAKAVYIAHQTTKKNSKQPRTKTKYSSLIKTTA